MVAANLSKLSFQTNTLTGVSCFGSDGQKGNDRRGGGKQHLKPFFHLWYLAFYKKILYTNSSLRQACKV